MNTCKMNVMVNSGFEPKNSYSGETKILRSGI